MKQKRFCCNICIIVVILLAATCHSNIRYSHSSNIVDRWTKENFISQQQVHQGGSNGFSVANAFNSQRDTRSHSGRCRRHRDCQLHHYCSCHGYCHPQHGETCRGGRHAIFEEDHYRSRRDCREVTENSDSTCYYNSDCGCGRYCSCNGYCVGSCFYK